MKYLEGSPEDGNFTSTFQTYYSISIEAFRHLFHILINDSDLEPNLHVLEELGVFKKSDSLHLLNPHLSIFGFLLKRCLENFQIIDKEIAKQMISIEIKYDPKLFDGIFNEIIDFIITDEIEVNIYYVLFGVQFQGDTFTYDINYNIQFILPNNLERESLSSDLRFQPSYITGSNPFFIFGWISSCTA